MKLPVWDDSALCQKMDGELFFPTSAEEWESRKQQLKAVCNNCPLYAQCLDYALRVKVYGVWAGTNVDERRKMRKRLGITAIPITLGWVFTDRSSN